MPPATWTTNNTRNKPNIFAWVRAASRFWPLKVPSGIRSVSACCQTFMAELYIPYEPRESFGAFSVPANFWEMECEEQNTGEICEETSECNHRLRYLQFLTQHMESGQRRERSLACTWLSDSRRYKWYELSQSLSTQKMEYRRPSAMWVLRADKAVRRQDTSERKPNLHPHCSRCCIIVYAWNSQWGATESGFPVRISRKTHRTPTCSVFKHIDRVLKGQSAWRSHLNECESGFILRDAQVQVL